MAILNSHNDPCIKLIFHLDMTIITYIYLVLFYIFSLSVKMKTFLIETDPFRETYNIKNGFFEVDEHRKNLSNKIYMENIGTK